MKVDGESLDEMLVLDLETVRVSFPENLRWTHLILAEYYGYIHGRRCVCSTSSLNLSYISLPQGLGKGVKGQVYPMVDSILRNFSRDRLSTLRKADFSPGEELLSYAFR